MYRRSELRRRLLVSSWLGRSTHLLLRALQRPGWSLPFFLIHRQKTLTEKGTFMRSCSHKLKFRGTWTKSTVSPALRWRPQGMPRAGSVVRVCFLEAVCSCACSAIVLWQVSVIIWGSLSGYSFILLPCYKLKKYFLSFRFSFESQQDGSAGKWSLLPSLMIWAWSLGLPRWKERTESHCCPQTPTLTPQHTHTNTEM